MKPTQRDRIIVTSVISILLFAWLGFLVHRAPRFAGSGIGSAIGIAGALLMLVPLAYPIIKRIPYFHARIAPYISLQTWMTIHVYSGILGPLLGIIHAGHKFESWLGITLTATMLLVVVSGFVGHYLLSFVNQDVRNKLLLLQTARGDLDSAWGALQNAPEETRKLPRMPLFVTGLASFGLDFQYNGPAADVTRLAESVADIEYAIRTHELFKRWCSRWLTLHLVLSLILYLLLVLHIWAAIHFGLRWFS